MPAQVGSFGPQALRAAVRVVMHVALHFFAALCAGFSHVRRVVTHARAQSTPTPGAKQSG